MEKQLIYTKEGNARVQKSTSALERSIEAKRERNFKV